MLPDSLPGVFGFLASPPSACLACVLGDGDLPGVLLPALSVLSPLGVRPLGAAGETGLCLGDGGRVDLGVVAFCWIRTGIRETRVGCFI